VFGQALAVHPKRPASGFLPCWRTTLKLSHQGDQLLYGFELVDRRGKAPSETGMVTGFGLFALRQSKVTLEGGEVLNLTDFQVIDEPAFNRSSDEAFLDLRKSGALGLLYRHLASTNSWTSLVHQASMRG
jgi:hypothetical protein